MHYINTRRKYPNGENEAVATCGEADSSFENETHAKVAYAYVRQLKAFKLRYAFHTILKNRNVRCRRAIYQHVGFQGDFTHELLYETTYLKSFTYLSAILSSNIDYIECKVDIS